MMKHHPHRFGALAAVLFCAVAIMPQSSPAAPMATEGFVTNRINAAVAPKADTAKVVSETNISEQTWWKMGDQDWWFTPESETEWKFGNSAGGWPHLRSNVVLQDGNEYWCVFYADGDTMPQAYVSAPLDADQLDFRLQLGRDWLLTRHVFDVTNTTDTTVTVVYSDDLASATNNIAAEVAAKADIIAYDRDNIYFVIKRAMDIDQGNRCRITSVLDGVAMTDGIIADGEVYAAGGTFLIDTSKSDEGVWLENITTSRRHRATVTASTSTTLDAVLEDFSFIPAGKYYFVVAARGGLGDGYMVSIARREVEVRH